MFNIHCPRMSAVKVQTVILSYTSQESALRLSFCPEVRDSVKIRLIKLYKGQKRLDLRAEIRGLVKDKPLYAA